MSVLSPSIRTQHVDFAVNQATRTEFNRDELSREVFGIMGIPIDPIGLPSSLRALEAAVEKRQAFLISTPNVNFLISSHAEARFRESLLASDLCIADGMPIVWFARLLGVPITDRVSGADLFAALKAWNRYDRRFGVFLFGGGGDVAAQIGRSLNIKSRGLRCVGTLNPGFGDVEEMSTENIIQSINASGADVIALFLSASKAQEWLLQNHNRLTIPVRVQFGATVNFETGTVRRAPPFLRRVGLEWLWRIKEEPYLWRRYWSDGRSLLWMLLIRGIPLSVDTIRLRLGGQREFRIGLRETDDSITVDLSGFAVAAHVGDAIEAFRTALANKKAIDVDVSKTIMLDPRFFGLLLMVRKQLRNRLQKLRFVQVSPATRRLFRRNGFEFLLSD